MQCQNRNYAPFFARLVAYLMDLFIIGIAGVIIGLVDLFMNFIFPDNIFTRAIWFNYSIIDAVKYILTTVYFVICTYCSGQTLGKKIMNIKVVSADENKLSLGKVIYRETIGRILHTGFLKWLYLTTAFTGKRQGIHDILSDTVVVYSFKEENFTDEVNYQVKNEEQPISEESLITLATNTSQSINDMMMRQEMDISQSVNNMMMSQEIGIPQPVNDMMMTQEMDIPQSMNDMMMSQYNEMDDIL